VKHLEEHSEDVLCLTGADQGPLGKLLLLREETQVNQLFQELTSIFGDRLYVELMRHNLPEQKTLEPQFLALARTHKLPIVATNDVFFATKDMFVAYDALLCISEGRFLYDQDREHASDQKFFKSSDEMATLFADLPESIENTVEIAKRCSFVLKDRAPILPPFESSSGLSEKDELRQQAISGLEKRLIEQVYTSPAAGVEAPSPSDSSISTPPSLLPHEANQDINSDANKALHKLYFDRLNSELSVIESMGFPGYFLIVSDFIKFAKSQNIPVGPGRGSGAGSLVAWALTITDIDPIRFDLIFERFLNPERISMPDFDVDFCQDRRNEVIDYVVNKYGQDKVAQIITFGKLQARAVLRDVGRVLAMPYPYIDSVCKLIPNNQAHQVTLKEAIAEDKTLQGLIKSDPTVEQLVNISQKLEGLYRHASTHAAGVVIGSAVISELVPLYYDGVSPIAITQINMKYIEKAGLLKFDFLGLTTLTIIQNCCDLVRKTGREINITTISLEDPKTFELLCATNVLGVFQLESGGMRDVLKKMKPDRLEDLIALVALYRPGPMDDIPKYLARKHGAEEVTYLHPKLQPILEKTYGVMVYQEQVMQIAQVLGGYTLGGADILRRAMGKKNKDEMDAQRLIFIEGAVKNEVDPVVAGQIFDLMAKFASYGFNKSHSAPYALVSYQTAYLKANYPVEFYAASATYAKNNTDKLTMFFQDMKKNGFAILGPDVNLSEVNFVPENGAIRYALSAIKNVGDHPMESLIAERAKNGAFKSVKDFASRIDPMHINKRQMENLVAAGALDSLHQNRKQLFESVNEIVKYANSCKQERTKATRSLFGDAPGDACPLRLAPEQPDWNVLERTQKEFEAIGFFMGEHPLDIYQDIIADLKLQSSSQFPSFASGRFVRLAAVILSVEVRQTRTGQKFASLTLSDHFGVFEVPFFADKYENARDIMEPGGVVYVEATVRANEDGSVRLIGQKLEKLEDKDQSDKFTIAVTEKVDVKEIKKILSGIRNEESEEKEIKTEEHDSGSGNGKRDREGRNESGSGYGNETTRQGSNSNRGDPQYNGASETLSSNASETQEHESISEAQDYGPDSGRADDYYNGYEYDSYSEDVNGRTTTGGNRAPGLRNKKICLTLRINNVSIFITLPGEYKISEENKAKLLSVTRDADKKSKK
jgi:DNA polymerase-3 subunit alpha